MEGDSCTEEIQKCKNWKECEKYEKPIDSSGFTKCANGLQCLANGLPSENLMNGTCYRTGEILYMKLQMTSGLHVVEYIDSAS